MSQPRLEYTVHRRVANWPVGRNSWFGFRAKQKQHTSSPLQKSATGGLRQYHVSGKITSPWQIDCTSPLEIPKSSTFTICGTTKFKKCNKVCFAGTFFVTGVREVSCIRCSWQKSSLTAKHLSTWSSTLTRAWCCSRGRLSAGG